MLKLIVILFILPFFLNAQEVKDSISSDKITIRFAKLIDVDYRFKIILDDFIQHMPSCLRKPQETECIYIDINAYLTYKAHKSLIDSLYHDNDFQKGIYSFPYDVYIECLSKGSKKMLSVFESEHCYLFNYRGFDVAFVSSLQLKFPYLGSYIDKQYNYSIKDNCFKSYYSVYTIGDFEVIKRNYIKLYSQPSGVELQKKYLKDKEKSDLLRKR